MTGEVSSRGVVLWMIPFTGFLFKIKPVERQMFLKRVGEFQKFVKKNQIRDYENLKLELKKFFFKKKEFSKIVSVSFDWKENSKQEDSKFEVVAALVPNFTHEKEMERFFFG